MTKQHARMLAEQDGHSARSGELLGAIYFGCWVISVVGRYVYVLTLLLPTVTGEQ